MKLLYFKLLFINIYLVTSFELPVLTNWERVLDQIIKYSDSLANIRATEKWIEQPLDHFDVNERRTWQMRYFEDLSHWRTGGPIILHIGGEGSLTGSIPFQLAVSSTSIFYELAIETNAALFFSEHRYYGQSQPFRNITTSNLKYLSSTQSLYDNANLLQFIKSNREYQASKVVVFGGSYSGNLAVWIRHLFPQIVDAAVASSAPVLAKKDFYEYAEVVGKVLKRYGSSQCYEAIAYKFARDKELLKTASGIETLKTENKICPGVDFTKKENVVSFIRLEMYTIMASVQNHDAQFIQNSCSSLNFFKTNNSCVDSSFDNFIQSSRRLPIISWMYQVCTEFGYFQTGYSKYQPFTDIVSKEIYVETCKRLFGPEFNEQRVDLGIARTNMRYGGLRPNVNKVVFVHGDMDPWSPLGVRQTFSSEAPVIVINGGSHCSDYVKPVNADARMKWDLIKWTVRSWIGL